MSNVSGQYNSVYNQNVLRNIFRPAYLFQSGTFKSRLDSYLPGNVVIGDDSTQYSLLLNGNNVGALDLRLWSQYPAVSTVNLLGNNISGCSNLYASNVIAGNITTTIGNITVPQGNIVLTSGNIVALGNIDATRITATSSVVAENIGSATLFCTCGSTVIPYVLQPSSTTISYSSVTHPTIQTYVPVSVVLAPHTTFTSSNVTITNVSSIPVMTSFPYNTHTPNLATHSYNLRGI